MDTPPPQLADRPKLPPLNLPMPPDLEVVLTPLPLPAKLPPEEKVDPETVPRLPGVRLLPVLGVISSDIETVVLPEYI